MRGHAMSRLLMVGVLVVLAVAALAWILGPDWESFKNAWKGSARDQILSLVEESRLKVARAEEKIEQAQKGQARLPGQIVRLRAHLDRIDRQKGQAEAQIARSRSDLQWMRKRLGEGLPVRTVSGRKLTVQQARLRVRRLQQQLALAGEKLTFMDQLRRKGSARLAKLQQQHRDGAFALEQLAMSRDALLEKAEWYEQMASLTEDLPEGAGGYDELLAEAQRTLEEAHVTLDARLAMAEGLPAAEEPIDRGEDVEATEQLASEIGQILSEGETLVRR